MEKDIKNYDLQLIQGIIKKYKYYGRGVSMYVFDYRDLGYAKKVIDQKNAIYIINQSKSSNEIYIGQTTQGPQRFAAHKMKEHQNEAEIYYFTFDNKPTRNILDALERRLIQVAETEGYIIKNDNKGVSTDIEVREEQYIDDNIVIINYLLQVVGIQISIAETTKEIKMAIRNPSAEMKNDFNETFFVNGVDATIERKDGRWILKRGSKTNALKWWEKKSDKPRSANYNFAKNAILLLDGNGVVKRDIEWNSISPLTAFAKGLSTNSGWVSVKNKEGKTPDELYRK